MSIREELRQKYDLFDDRSDINYLVSLEHDLVRRGHDYYEGEYGRIVHDSCQWQTIKVKIRLIRRAWTRVNQEYKDRGLG